MENAKERNLIFMTNKEYYRDLLVDIALDTPVSVGLSKLSGVPVGCKHLGCRDCVFNNNKSVPCSSYRKEWAKEE